MGFLFATRHSYSCHASFWHLTMKYIRRLLFTGRGCAGTKSGAQQDCVASDLDISTFQPTPLLSRITPQSVHLLVLPILPHEGEIWYCSSARSVLSYDSTSMLVELSIEYGSYEYRGALSYSALLCSQAPSSEHDVRLAASPPSCNIIAASTDRVTSHDASERIGGTKALESLETFIR